MKYALFILAALLLAFAFRAEAHDWVKADGTKVDASWIMKNPLISWCCGPEDCEPVPGKVRYTPAGWEVRGLKGTIPLGDTYPSVDGQPWACRSVSTNRLRCLFLPEGKN